MVGVALAPPNRGAASSAPTSWVVMFNCRKGIGVYIQKSNLEFGLAPFSFTPTSSICPLSRPSSSTSEIIALYQPDIIRYFKNRLFLCLKNELTNYQK